MKCMSLPPLHELHEARCMDKANVARKKKTVDSNFFIIRYFLLKRGKEIAPSPKLFIGVCFKTQGISNLIILVPDNS